MADIHLWRYYLGFYRGLFPAFAASLFLAIGQSLLMLPMVILVRKAFDRAIPAGNLRLLVLIGIGLLALNLAGSGLALWARHLVLKVNKLAVGRLRQDLLSHCLFFSRSFYNRCDRERLHASIVQDSERLDVMSNALGALLLPALFISIALSVILVYLNFFLFLLMLAVAPFMYGAGQALKKRARLRVNAFHRSFESFSRGVLFVLHKIDMIRVQTAEAFETERHRRQIEDLGQRGGAMAWLHAAQYLVLKGIGSVSGIVILMVGGAAVAAGKVTLGALLAFYYAAVLFHSQLGMIIAAIPDVIAGREALATLHGIATADDRSFYVGKRLIDFHGEIILKGVSFDYDGPSVLQEVNLTLQPGTITGLIGANGSGKTTIAYLIMGFYRPQAGEIFADGRSYLELDIFALRRRIGMVMQDSMLIPGTIRENIAYGHPEANWRDVEKAAELAIAQPFIAGLSHGYETMVGHEGELLSGGQRQHIVLARALLRHPALLILDEPSNHLDVDTVNAFFDNLKKMDPLPTVLIIGHDRHIVRLNGQILIARNGRVVSEPGAWEEGLKQALDEEKRK